MPGAKAVPWEKDSGCFDFLVLGAWVLDEDWGSRCRNMDGRLCVAGGGGWLCEVMCALRFVLCYMMCEIIVS